MDTLAAKRETLRRELATSEHLLVAYSGGVDSAYLAWEAYQVLGDRMQAVIADSPSLPRKHLSAAIDFAQQHNIPLSAFFSARAHITASLTPEAAVVVT